MTPALKPKIYTEQEYLDLEVNASERHEYINGEIKLMTGGTPNHNEIVSNLLVALKLSLKGKPYRTFVTDQRLWIPDYSIYTYPDIMVLPTPIQLQEGRNDTVMNACLIAEVLSKSTQDYDRAAPAEADRSQKFLAYRTINNFQEYLLIDQYRVYVEHYLKTASHQWLLSEYSDRNIVLTLKAIDTKIKIADLYENIEFDRN